MTWSRTLLLPLVLATFVPDASAGLFSRKTKPNPAERVPDLLIQLRTNADEGQRTAAAEELQLYDPKVFPDIIVALIDSLGHDASAVVRSEAATSLGRLRPITQQAGYALEQSQNNDAVVRVRLAARQALWQYHLVGYRGGKTADGPATALVESTPDANGAAKATTPRTIAQPTSRTVPGTTIRETAEPPLAVPPTTSAVRPTPGPQAQLIPANPGLQPLPRTSETAKTKRPAAGAAPAAPSNDGPALPPPN